VPHCSRDILEVTRPPSLIFVGQVVLESFLALGILAVDFVERGRNVLSSARDGLVHLFDVPTQTSVTRYCLLMSLEVSLMIDLHGAMPLGGSKLERIPHFLLP